MHFNGCCLSALCLYTLTHTQVSYEKQTRLSSGFLLSSQLLHQYMCVAPRLLKTIHMNEVRVANQTSPTAFHFLYMN